MHAVEPHTLLELQLLPAQQQGTSMLHYYDRTETQGGRDRLKAMLQKPGSSRESLEATQLLLKLMVADLSSWKIDIHRSYVNAVENYHALSVAHSMSQDAVMHWLDTFVYFIRNPAEFYRIQSGLSATLRFLGALKKLVESLDPEYIPAVISHDIEVVRSFINAPAIAKVLQNTSTEISKTVVFRLDYFFRVKQLNALREVLDFYYQMDAYRAIALTAQEKQLCFPQVVANGEHFLCREMWHPLLKSPVANDFDMNAAAPVCIMTGANTSGKTTFLKTLGITVYLAHLGWPVPAKELQTPFFDQLFTSIHLTDDLEAGFSHFYTEMMRIKVMVQALERREKCLVIVDELFRGTNHDDSLACSNIVVQGFTTYSDSYFVISTHLMECVKEFERDLKVHFKCFRTSVDHNQLIRTFKIDEGVAREKVGRLIMEQVGITDLLKNRKRLPEH